MIQRNNINHASYANMERAVMAHQEAQGRTSALCGLITTRSGDKAVVAPKAFHDIACHQTDGNVVELLTPRDSMAVVSKLKSQGILDQKNHVASLAHIDGVLDAVRIGSGRGHLSANQQQHVRMVLHLIRSKYGVRRTGEGLLQKMDRINRDLKKLNKQADQLLHS